MKNGEWSLRQQRDENAILVRLFMRLLPVQAMIIAMGSINALIDGVIADLLGANETLKAPLCTYITGYAIGIIPQLLGQQFASSLQLERKEKLGHIAVSVIRFRSLNSVFIMISEYINIEVPAAVIHKRNT